ncbi:MAG: polysaccharide pyruvyl transferase family protein [Dehalococcoidales bacterium]|nr:polysaccharide pyruvyl transferase family protein [Dehalococcoidales bacterium]
MGGLRRVYRVGISGSYGGLNLGDEAILRVIVTELRRSVPVEITVFSRNPADTLARHDVDRALPVRQLSRQEVRPEVARLDLLILGGGGILFDSEAGIYLREAMLAHELGVPVMVYAIGAGPLRSPAAQRMVRDCLGRAAVVTVRERRARQVLEEAGLQDDIIVTADPALLLEPQPLPEDALRREGMDGSRRLVGISVREPGAAAPDIKQEEYHQLLANAADYMVDRLDADLVFVPMEPHVLDTQHSHAVIARMAYPRRATVLKGEYTSGQILTLMENFAFAVGMRLHFLIFAALQRVPFVALPYASKVTGFLEALDLDALPVQRVHAGQLLAHIDRSWDLRRETWAHIDAILPQLQEHARETHRIAVRLLEGGGAAVREA